MVQTLIEGPLLVKGGTQSQRIIAGSSISVLIYSMIIRSCCFFVCCISAIGIISRMYTLDYRFVFSSNLGKLKATVAFTTWLE